MGQLQLLKMKEGRSVEEYVKRTRELKNQLGNMGEKLLDRNVNQLVLNGLPRSFESMIQTLTHLDATMSFEKLSAALVFEAHRREHRTQQLEEEEALAATHGKRENKQNQYQSDSNQGRDRGGWQQ